MKKPAIGKYTYLKPHFISYLLTYLHCIVQIHRFLPIFFHQNPIIRGQQRRVDQGALGYRSIVTIFSPLLLYYFHLDAPFRFGSPCANHDKRSTSVSYLQFSLECILLYYVGNTDRERDVSFLNHRWIQDEVCCYKKNSDFSPSFYPTVHIFNGIRDDLSP